MPVIIDRQLQQSPGYDARLRRAGSRLDSVSRSRAPIPRREAFGMGGVVSESVSLTGADGYQAGNLVGAGVRVAVAVIDPGFSGLSARIAEGELPPCNVSFNPVGVETGGQHGTGVAEHMLDMAPGVELHCLKIADSVDMVNNAGTVRASSTIPQSRFTDPAEGIAFTCNSAKVPYHLRVVRNGGNTSGLDITLFSFNRNFDQPVRPPASRPRPMRRAPSTSAQ